jgi:CheY-like chemotaxis protein
MGQSSLALHKLPKESPAVNNITKAINASEHAADLTRQLLAYSGRGKFINAEIDLNSLVKENVQMLEVSVPKTTQLQYALGSSSPRIIGDVGQIQQVIMNLIINAGEAMGPNPGYIILRTDQVELRENDTGYWKYTNIPLAPGSYAKIQVRDTGSGISQETLTRIFDPFFTTKFTGRGLGLAAVLGIIKGHKGGLRIESEEGKGTLFEVVLPIANSSAASKTQEKKKNAPIDGKGKTILIIDDDPFVFDLLNDTLTEARFTVTGAMDPVKGIEIYSRNHASIDLIILDYSMPGMDGKKAFQELLMINQQAKILLCSGYTEEETLTQFGNVRPAGFFQKPYKAHELLERMAQVLSNDH